MDKIEWVECDDWANVPVGSWLVALSNGDHHIATRITKNTPLFIGFCFHFEIGDIVAYTTFTRYG